MPLDTTSGQGPRLLSDAQFGIGAAPKLMSDVDFGLAPPPSPAFNTEYGPTPTTEAPARPQSLPEAAISAVGQGAVSGAGATVGGIGDIAKAGDVPWSQQVLKAFDLVDEGKNRDAYQKLTEAQRQQVGAYRSGTPDDKAAQRAALQQTIDDSSKPSLLQRTGTAMEEAAPSLYPVDPAQEGHLTAAGRMVGGVGPMVLGGALGGPGGALAGAAAIGAQAFHTTRQDALASGASDEEADTAAGQAALGQMAAMSVPLGKVLPMIPVPLRDGFLKTVANAGANLTKSGIELGAGNTLGTIAQNYVAAQTYDPARPVFQSTGDASIDGFLAGLVVHSAGALARSARPSVADIGAAGTVDDAIKAADAVARTPSEAGAAAQAETAIGGAAAAPAPTEAAPAPVQAAAAPPALRTTLPAVVAPEPGAVALSEMNVPESVGAAASRQGTPLAQLVMTARDAASSRYQGEVERLAAPPTVNDKNIYIPNTQLSLAETTGDPVDAMSHQYNRQQPAAAPFHTAREDNNADLVTAYYADTAGSKPTLDRMMDARSALAKSNIQQVFGNPNDARPPADPTPTLDLLRGMRNDPRQAQRDAISLVIGDLQKRFYDNRDPTTGNLITDPYALYGIGEHINDLLNGVGNTETSSAARALERELLAIKTSLYNDIETAAPGFAKYRADYQRDSQAITAMKYLQDERIPLLGTNLSQRITPSKWATFMKNTIQGRADPMDPASALSEDQMDRLWNITDQLKRQTLESKGKPQGSWTSLMHEIGIRSVGRLVGHIASAVAMPVVGNVAVELMNSKMRERDVMKEMQRHLHPDLGQGPLP